MTYEFKNREKARCALKYYSVIISLIFVNMSLIIVMILQNDFSYWKSYVCS